ncbi:hypothetical protein BC832DRAFT_192537 [Gaertneriomyces semiglobifer]|nr:hypothetical protein BC832DRAFT_192537 [Gaertneriomyces semiglobifer]
MAAFDDLIVEATSETNTSPPWHTLIALCERLNSSPSSTLSALNTIVSRLSHKNVNVILYTLTLSNSLITTCVPAVKREFSSRLFVDALVRLVEGKGTHEAVKGRVLELMQQWVEDYNDDDGGYLKETFERLKRNGVQFPGKHRPEVVKTQAMIDKEKEDEDLQLALALSLSAQESQSRQSLQPAGGSTQSAYPAAPPSPLPQPGSNILFQVKALYDFVPTELGELALNLGDVVSVHDATTFQDWWKGTNTRSGQIGIFPSNYVEKLKGDTTSSAAAAAADVARAGRDEDEVLAKGFKVDEFKRTLASVDPRRDNLSENDALQTGYSELLALRPKVVKLVESYRAKQEELHQVSARFTRACSTYHRLMDGALQQQQVYRTTPPVAYAPQPNTYDPYQPQHGVLPPPSVYGAQQGVPFAPPPQQPTYGQPYPGY